MARDIITYWLNVRHVHMQKTAGTDVTPSDNGRTLDCFVHSGSSGEDLFICEETETDFMLWKPVPQLL